MLVHDRIVFHELKLGNVPRVFPVRVEKAGACVRNQTNDDCLSFRHDAIRRR